MSKRSEGLKGYEKIGVSLERSSTVNLCQGSFSQIFTFTFPSIPLQLLEQSTTMTFKLTFYGCKTRRC